MEQDHGGWRLFAGLLILLVGIFNFIDGIVAIADPKYFAYYSTADANSTVVTHHLVFADLTSWGWTLLVFGVLQALVAAFIFFGRAWAALFGIALVGLNTIAQLLLIGVYPWWSIIAIALDILIIYALVQANLSNRTERG
jgi:hypothetical protein